MKTHTHNLPPGLSENLMVLLRRYRRHRMLRSALRLLILGFVPSMLAVGLWVSEAPISTNHILMAWGGIVAIIAVWAFWPVLTRPLSLRDVAREVDQRHPELKDRLLSAVALTEGPDSSGGSGWMLEAFFSETENEMATASLDNIVQQEEVWWAAMLSVLCLAVYAIAMGALWQFRIEIRANLPEEIMELATLSPLTVKPGDVTVVPGENVAIWVTSNDTASARHIFWEADGQADSALMTSSSGPELSYHPFGGIGQSTTYWVVVGDQESEHFTITVLEPPDVASLQVGYDYPDYLELADRVVPFSGDIAAVEGTVVTLTAKTNKPVVQAQLRFESGAELALSPDAEGMTWTGELTLTASDTYEIALHDDGGAENPYPETYTVDVQPDLPPKITVRLPRGDREALALEEVDFAFEVVDDFGVVDYGIEYTIAGQEPTRIPLNAEGDIRREMEEAYLLALESMEVTAGDLVTWAIWADDRKPGRLSYETLSDPYFLEIRPYSRRYREQLSQAGQGASSGPGVEQREVVNALWNLRKSAPTLSEEEFDASKEKIRSAQQTIREKAAEELAAGQGDEAILEEAIKHMTDVEESLARALLPKPDDALSNGNDAAQQALHSLLKLAPEERQIARTEGQGSGSGSNAEEIEELELSKRKDYQEEARTGQEDVAASEALRNALEELARRQEVLNEDVGKTLAEKERLSEEEKKRRLERLEKEQQRQLESLDKLAKEMAESTMDASQRESAAATMEEAREAMESSMESVRQEALQQARAAGSRAERALEAAEKSLAELTREDSREAFAGLQEALDALAARHEALEADRDALRESQSAPGLQDAEAANERMNTYKEEKSTLAEDTRGLLEDAGTLSDQVRAEQGFISRKLGDWVRKTSRTGVVEDMLEGPKFAEYGMWDAAGMADAKVEEKLEAAQAGLGEVAEAWFDDPNGGMAQALERLAALEDSLAGEEAGPADSGAGQEGTEDTGPNPSSNEGAPAAAGAPGEGKAPGNVPGTDGERPGQTPGTEPGEEGAGADGQAGSPGETPGESPGITPGSPPGETPGTTPGSGSGQTMAGGETPGGGNTGGDFGAPGDRRGASQGGLGQVLDEGTWRGEIADAAALLPRNSAERAAVEQVGMNLVELQRAYDASKSLPEPEALEQVVQRPLREVISQLETAIARAENQEAWMEDDGAVPDTYVDRVAEYTRLLAESPEAQ